MHHDGDKVIYQGHHDPARSGPHPGDQGQVLLADERTASVYWDTGKRLGQVDTVEQDDLVVSTAQRRTVQAEMADSLAYGDPEDTAVDLLDEGVLTLDLVGDEVMETIGQRVREQIDGRLRTASEADEESLVREATRRVLTDLLDDLEDDS